MFFFVLTCDVHSISQSVCITCEYAAKQNSVAARMYLQSAEYEVISEKTTDLKPAYGFGG